MNCDTTDKHKRPDDVHWLTVKEIAGELKISRSIVYKLISTGELEAINIVADNGSLPQKGHYRISRANLTRYIEAKKVRPLLQKHTRASAPKAWPKVKNHLGL